MTFLGFKLIKYLEFCLALYTLAVGASFLLRDGFVDSVVYLPWKEGGITSWGVALSLVATAHVTALWLNGRNHHISRLVRAVACSCHFFIAAQFAVFFVEGAAQWGAYTMAFLVAVLLPVLGSAIDEAREVWGSNNACE